MNKLKYLFGGLALALICLSGPAVVKAADVEVTLSTVVHNGTPSEFVNAGYPQISNGAYIRSITIANYSDIGTGQPQVIDLYRNGTSTTAATIEMTYVVPASSTLHMPIPSARGWNLRDVIIKKSHTNSTVKAQIVYE